MENNFSADFEKNLSYLIEKQIREVLDEKIEHILSEKISKVIEDVKQQSIEVIEESDMDEMEKQKIIASYSDKVDKKLTAEWNVVKKINDLSEQLKIRDIDKFLNENHINFNKRKFLYYIEQDIIPKASEKISKNQALYSKTHILMYILVGFFEDQLQIDKIKELIGFLKPLIEEVGLDKFVEYAYSIQKSIDKDFVKDYSEAIVSSSEYLITNIHHDEKPSELMLYSANIIGASIMSKKYGEILDYLMKQYDENNISKNEYEV